MMTRKAILKREAAEYMSTLDITQEERKDLLDWIRGGNSVHDNPWYMAFENGFPMDYISAIREVNDQRQSITSSTDFMLS